MTETMYCDCCLGARNRKVKAVYFDKDDKKNGALCAKCYKDTVDYYKNGWIRRW